MKNAPLKTAAVYALAFCAFSSAVFADLRVVGTDLLGVDFTKAFYEYSGQKGIKLALAFDGSRSGLEDLKAGRADLAIVTLPADEERTKLGFFQVVPLAHHRVVVVVPSSCPLDTITLDQLATVFGAPALEAGGNAMRWQSLGVTGEWSTAAIAPVLPDPGTGITMEYFRATVLQGRALRGNVQRFATTAELLVHFAGESRALALVPMVPPGATNMKTLSVASSGTGGAGAGDYPLQVPVHLVFRPDRVQALAAIFAFSFSDGAARVLGAAGLVPLSAVERAEQLKRLR